MNRISITIDLATAAWLDDTLPDGISDCPVDEARVEMQRTHDEARDAMKLLLLIERATEVGEVDGITFYEHPDHGDEAPLMAYHDDLGFFRERTPFHDLPDEDDPDLTCWFEEELKND